MTKILDQGVRLEEYPLVASSCGMPRESPDFSTQEALHKRLRICYFSALFPPLVDSEAIVSGKLAKWLKDAGNDVRIYSAPCPSPHQGRAITTIKDIRAIIRFNFCILARQTIDAVRLWEINQYVNGAIRLSLQEHRERPFDVIVSRYEPIESAIAAYWVSRRLRIPWVASVNDPFPRIYPDRISPWEKLMDKVHRSAMAVWHQRLLVTPSWRVFPCQRLYRWVIDRAKKARISLQSMEGRYSIIPHMGYPVAAANSHARASVREEQIRTLRHLGNLGEKREIRVLIEALELWNTSGPFRLRLEFIGNVAPRHRRLLEGFAMRCSHRVQIGLRETVAPAEALRLTQTASACLLIEAPGDESIFLPSKFCDYATAGKPILAISPEKSTVREYFEKCGGGEAVTHADGRGLYTALRRILSSRVKGSEALASEFDPNTVGTVWESLLSTLVAKKER